MHKHLSQFFWSSTSEKIQFGYFMDKWVLYFPRRENKWAVRRSFEYFDKERNWGCGDRLPRANISVLSTRVVCQYSVWLERLIVAPGGSFVTIVSSWCVVGRGNNALCGLMNSWAWWGGVLSADFSTAHWCPLMLTPVN